MRLDVILPKGDDRDFSISTSHGGEVICWNMMSRTINTSKDEEAGSNIFEPLNRYLESLDSQRQEAIFNCYKRIYKVFSGALDNDYGSEDVERLARRIRPIMKEMFDLTPEKEVIDWTWFTLVPGYPVDIKDVFTTDMPGTPERTYLTEDYRRLIPMAIICRLAFPIITEYIHSSRDELGKLHKESAAFTLLYGTWVYNSEPMRRLYVFVDHTVGADRENDNAIMSGIGSQNFIEWVLAFLVIRRLMKAELRGNSVPSVVSTLYNGVDTRMKQVLTSGRNVKIKRYTENSTDSDNNLSILESFRTKDEITTGDLAVFREYISRQTQFALNGDYPAHSLVARIDPTIPHTLINDCYNVQVKRKNYQYKPIQIILMMWLFSDYISPRVAPHLNKSNIVGLTAIAQAYFIHNKKYDFAMLVGSTYRFNINDADRPITDGASAIPKHMMQKFVEIFPYYKKGSFDGSSSRVSLLLPIVTLDTYVSALKSYEITPSPHTQRMVNTLGVPGIPSVYTPPKSIRIKLAEFLMELATTEKKSINWDTLAIEQGFNPSSVSY